MGAWIEMAYRVTIILSKYVAPLVGARIEIEATSGKPFVVTVAPLVGARIEISLSR